MLVKRAEVPPSTALVNFFKNTFKSKSFKTNSQHTSASIPASKGFSFKNTRFGKFIQKTKAFLTKDRGTVLNNFKGAHGLAQLKSYMQAKWPDVIMPKLIK